MARILVVDDQKISRLTLAGILGEAGHEVRTEGGGADGLEAAREWLPDVIILDVHMPEMGGFEVVEKLKEAPETEAIPVVFLTGDPATDDLVVRGLDLGAYDFLSKGCSKSELLARVGAMHRIKRSHDEIAATARISEALLRSVEPGDLGREFVAEARRVFRARAAVLAVEWNGHASVRVEEGLDADRDTVTALLAAIRDGFDPHDAVLGWVLDAGEVRSLLRPHLGEEIGAAAAACVRRGPTEAMVVVLADEPDHFQSRADAALLEHLSSQAAIAIEHALLNERARQQTRDLERAMSERSRFFASLSHELRTPINAVIGYNHLLQEEIFGELSDRQQEAISKANRSAQHLLELVDDILDISKIEAGKLEIAVEEVNLAALIRDTATSVRIQAREKGLDLEVETPDEVRAVTDPARVRQVVLNLLSNAVKFTAEGSVTLRLDADGDGSVRLAVRDTGPGIAAEDLDRIFDEFEQASTGGETGTGLGLAISRRLAELLGGSLEVQSEPGTGSTFTLHLPREWDPSNADSEWEIGGA
jgi:signal transduction histidine kinase/FixJ family two-component response regulator